MFILSEFSQQYQVCDRTKTFGLFTLKLEANDRDKKVFQENCYRKHKHKH